VVRAAKDAHAISVEMRDSTGLMDNIRRSPLMQGLQVTPDEDQFGPDAFRVPSEDSEPAPELGEEMGPDLEEQGPATSAIRIGSETESVAARSGQKGWTER